MLHCRSPPVSTALPWRDRERDAAPCGTHRFGMAILHEKQYRKTTFLHLLAKALSNAAQDASGWLGHAVFFCSLVVHQNLQVFFSAKLISRHSAPSLSQCQGLFLQRAQFGISLCVIPLCLQPVWMAAQLSGLSTATPSFAWGCYGTVESAAKTVSNIRGPEASVEFAFYSLCLNGLTISVLGKRINHLKSIILRVILHSLYQQLGQPLISIWKKPYSPSA